MIAYNDNSVLLICRMKPHPHKLSCFIDFIPQLPRTLERYRPPSDQHHIRLYIILELQVPSKILRSDVSQLICLFVSNNL
jgi:hypothetical protein